MLSRACVVLCSCAMVNAQDATATNKPARALGEIDVFRIQELHHITDVFGDKIWPGFDTRKIPIAINNDNREELLARTRERFGYDELLAQQKKLVEDRLNLIRRYIDAPGRRYCIYYNRIRKGFNWEPFGPVYPVPASLEKELAEKRKGPGRAEGTPRARRTVWVGGIRRFEMAGLTFSSRDTPVVFGLEYIEWIDPDPAPDKSDMKITCDRQEEEAYVAVKIETDGFTLEADKARIEWSKDVVRIYPEPKQSEK